MFDTLLATLLLVVLPAYMFWKSTISKRSEARLPRYIRLIAVATLLSIAVLAEWAYKGRSFVRLGLGAPTSPAALVGLGIACCVLIAMAISLVLRSGRRAPSGKDDPSKEIMPQTQAELFAFVVFCFVVGGSWELLYRGYLLWVLTHFAGVIGAGIIAAAAYGVGHGFRNAKMFAASLISAVVFTGAYILTQNLWWLMVVHCGLPLIGAVAFRLQRDASDAPSDEQGGPSAAGHSALA